MISVQSHAKQVKLLNDYIGALEKQISSSRKQNQLLQTSTANTGEEQKRLAEEINRLRAENGQLKYQNYKQQEELHRLAGLEQQYFATCQQLSRQVQLKNQSSQENQALTEALKKEQDVSKALSEDFNKKRQAYETEASKNKQEIQELRKIQMAKDKKYAQLTLMLSQEKKNSTTKMGLMQAENSMMIQNKNQTIAKLIKEADELKSTLSAAKSQAEKDRNQSNAQISKLQNLLAQKQSDIANLSAEKDKIDSANSVAHKEIDSLKASLKSKTEQFDSLLKKTNSEKRSLLQAVDKLGEEKKRLQTKVKETELLISLKNKQINNLNSTLQAKAQQFDGLVRKATDQKTNLLQTIDKFTKQNKQLQQTIRQRDLTISVKNKEINNFKETLKVKVQQYDILTKETSQHRRSLQQTINMLQEQKRNLEVINIASKGNISENSKALADTLKQKEQVTIKLSSTASLLQKTEKDLERTTIQLQRIAQQSQQKTKLIQQLKKTVIQKARNIADLSEKLQSTENSRLKSVRQAEQLTKQLNKLKSQNKSQKQQFLKLTQESQTKILTLTNKLQNLQQSKIQQSKKLKKIISDLEFERDSKNMDLSETGQKVVQFNHRISDLQKQKQSLQQNLQTSNQEFLSFRKKKEAQIQDLTVKLKQSQKKLEKSKLKIEDLSREIKELESHHQNNAQNLTLTQRQEVQLIKAKMSKTISQMHYQNQQKISQKNHQIQQLRKQIIKLTEANIKSLKTKQQQYISKQKLLQQNLKQLTIDNQSLLEQIKKGNKSVVLEKHSQQTKQFEFQNLKQKIDLLQNASREQNKIITQLKKSIVDKNRQYQVLQESNALLRKQVVNVLTREQSSRKQLLQIKSSFGSTYNSKSRANIGRQDFENVSIYQNTAKNRKINGTSSRIGYAPSMEKRVSGRKLQVPHNLAASLVNQVKNFQGTF